MGSPSNENIGRLSLRQGAGGESATRRGGALRIGDDEIEASRRLSGRDVLVI
jgi:hypothetical protein